MDKTVCYLSHICFSSVLAEVSILHSCYRTNSLLVLFIKGSSTKLVAFVKSQSMFPWRQQFNSYPQAGKAEKQWEQMCYSSVRSLSRQIKQFLSGKVIKEATLLGGLGVPAFIIHDVMKYDIKLCKVRLYLPSREILLYPFIVLFTNPSTPSIQYQAFYLYV